MDDLEQIELAKVLRGEIDKACQIPDKWMGRSTSTASEVATTCTLTADTLGKVKAYFDEVQPPSLFDAIRVGGMKVFSSPWCAVHEQFRFPGSKKKRVRKKWAKDERNWRDRPLAFIVGGKDFVAHPSIAARLEHDMAKSIDDRLITKIMGREGYSW